MSRAGVFLCMIGKNVGSTCAEAMHNNHKTSQHSVSLVFVALFISITSASAAPASCNKSFHVASAGALI